MKKLPLIMEIIGLAGTGKSTLSSALYRQNKKFLASERLGSKETKHRLFYIEQSFLLLPTFLRLPRNGSWFTRGDIKKMVYLNGWHRVLKRQGSHNNAIIVVDQGPIFKLATLYEFGPEKLKDQSFDEWWDQLFKQWASTLDMVVWLDGSDDILIERIISRDSWHLVKELSTQEAQKFFSDYRLAFNYIISKLTSIEDITVLRFDTSYKSPEGILAQVLSSFEKS
jgi:deoxyadenosine/deoxycytidine kinase